MKVLFYSTMGLSPLHFGNELELIDQEKSKGNEVHVLYCNSELASCFFNPCHNIVGCSICIQRTQSFYQYLNIPKENIHELKFIKPDKSVSAPMSKNLGDLLAYEYRGYNIGRGIVSSVISLERNFDIFSDRILKLIEVQHAMAVNVVLNMEYILNLVKPDLVYLFNGRFAELFPLIEICKKRQINYITYERASSTDKYQTYQNSLPHSIKARKNFMLECWNSSNVESREIIGSAWYVARRRGESETDSKYLAEQEEGCLPTNISHKKMNIAIFNSSEDEMKAIGEWNNSLYDNQNEAIIKILENYKEAKDIHFYLRIHPNLKSVDNPQTEELYQLAYPNLTVIMPGDTIDTYALMDACDKTLTFGSTTGIEATFWGNPSILFGRSFFENMDCQYEPKDYKTLFALLDTTDLPAKPKENTLIYGYYLSTYGNTFQHFKYDGKNNSAYKQKKIRRITLRSILILPRLLTQIPLWLKMNRIIFGRSFKLGDIFILKSHTMKR